MKWLLSGLLIFALVASSLAQQQDTSKLKTITPQAAPQATPDVPPPIEPPPVAADDTSTSGSGVVPLTWAIPPTGTSRQVVNEFQGDDVAQVLRLLARQAKINIIVSDNVDQAHMKITMRLEDKTPLEAIHVIASAKGLFVDENDGVYYVKTKQEKDAEPFSKRGARAVDALAEYKTSYYKKLIEGGLPAETAAKIVADDNYISSSFFFHPEAPVKAGETPITQNVDSPKQACWNLAEKFGIGSVIFGWFAAVFSLPLTIIFAIIVFVDARRQKRQKAEKQLFDPFLWGLATLFGGFYVAAVYWYFHHRPKQPDI